MPVVRPRSKLRVWIIAQYRPKGGGGWSRARDIADRRPGLRARTDFASRNQRAPARAAGTGFAGGSPRTGIPLSPSTTTGSRLEAHSSKEEGRAPIGAPFLVRRVIGRPHLTRRRLDCGADRHSHATENPGTLTGREARRQQAVIDFSSHPEPIKHRWRQVQSHVVREAVGLGVDIPLNGGDDALSFPETRFTSAA